MTTPPDDTARPPVWAGHVIATSRDPRAAADFYTAIGMREVAVMDAFAILEMRGGTHLAVRLDPDHRPGPAGFDLMVEDLAATHASWSRAGLTVSEVTVGDIHESFTVTDPDGNVIEVSDTHVIGPV